MRRVMFGVVFGMVALGACAGDDDAAPTTTAIRSSTTTTTVPVETTTTTTTTIETTTSTTSTTATTAVIDETQAVIDAYQAAWNAFNEAKLDPTNDDRIAAARRLLGGDRLATFEAQIARWRQLGYRSVTDVTYPSRASVLVGSVELRGDTATLRACELDSNSVVEIGAAPDGSDAIVNEAIGSLVSESTLLWAGDRWVLHRTDTLQEYPGEVECPAS